MSEELKDILGDIKTEGTPLEELKDTAPEPEKEPEVEKSDDSPAGDLPFHQDPRWIRRENELKELRERDETREREIAELKTLRTQPEPQSTPVPEWFRELYGDNPTAWSKYSEAETKRADEIVEQTIKKQQEMEQKKVQEGQYWEGWVKDEMVKLKADGHDFDENAFAKFMLDYMPTTVDNNLDFEKGIALYEKLNPKETVNSDARKRLADTTTRSTSKEATKKDFFGPEDFKTRSFKDLAA